MMPPLIGQVSQLFAHWGDGSCGPDIYRSQSLAQPSLFLFDFLNLHSDTRDSRGSTARRTIKQLIKPHTHYIIYFENSRDEIPAFVDIARCLKRLSLQPKELPKLSLQK